MAALGVEMVPPNSPKAKGRVKRMNGPLQDRLVGISDIESANRFLAGKNLRAFNRQFARAAARPIAVQRVVPGHLNEVLRWEAARVGQGDWTVPCEGQRYQLARQREALSLVRREGACASAAQRASAVGVSGPGPQVAESACLGGAEGAASESEADEACKNESGEGTVIKSSVAAGRKFWNGIQVQSRAVRTARLGVRSANRPESRTPSWENERRRTSNEGDILP